MPNVLPGFKQKKILVCGAGGFIGNHLVNDLKKQGHYVIGVDLHYPNFNSAAADDSSAADEFVIADLTEQQEVNNLIDSSIYEIYQLAANMGGAGYIFTGVNDANIMRESSKINLNILERVITTKNKIFYASSACVYPEGIQSVPDSPFGLKEKWVYPANPDSEYGWEKLYSERLYESHARNYGLNIRIARLHNIYGPMCSINNGREKAIAAICRKVFESTGKVDVWGAGTQTRSFLFIDECLTGIHKLMASDYKNPINLGSDQSISINDLTLLVAKIAKKEVKINNINGPVGVIGRNSNNDLIRKILNWAPATDLEYGIKQTYDWIASELTKKS
jgi:nucleoside-diphosphate-sugar epimerase